MKKHNRMILKLAVKNIVSKRSSFVIIIFIAFAMMVLVAANSIFDSTEQGIERTFINSFTGDFFIRGQTNSSVSLFGDDTPLLGRLSRLSVIPDYENLRESLASELGLESLVPQLTGMGRIESDTGDMKIVYFGVPGQSYMNSMPSLKIVEGGPYADDGRGTMLSKSQAQKLSVAVGDTVQFTVRDGPITRIRAAVVSAIYQHEVENPVFDRYVLVDQHTVRALMDINSEAYTEEVDVSAEKTNLLDSDLDFESLFGENNDLDSAVTEEFPPASEEPQSAESQNSSAQQAQDAEDWHFIIGRCAGSSPNAAIRALNSFFKKSNIPLEALDWRHAAGSTAIYLFWLRIIFNIGIFVILAAGFIIINNTLVVNVLDRTREIGTMRAIGATRAFISVECMAETFIISVAAGILGTILGIICAVIINWLAIPLDNDFLIQLFGSKTLVTVINGVSISRSLVMILILGLAGWIYPMRAALSVNPVTAMQGGK